MSQLSPFERICLAINEKQNVFISGVGGCGKSFLLKQLYQHYRKLKVPCVLTSTTGISAYNLGGVTIHSWSKLIVPSGLTSLSETQVEKWAVETVKKLKRKRFIVKKYSMVKLIFIDEDIKLS